MARQRQRVQARRQYSRTDRISESIREIVATELERIGDERLDLVTVTGVVVDSDLSTAKVYYSALTAAEASTSEDLAEGFEAVRWPIQRVVNKAMTARRTPQISFLPDEVLSAALRIDDILAQRVEVEVAPVEEIGKLARARQTGASQLNAPATANEADR
ncbi:MAG TPA: 30S ribosome-binding factor RbfA [Acidimicrobiaceae bacterium]|jgi:ribosome-binding factor A|nr:30S ribosome-binding factor RbfA [Acidimicrobiaceae bacterium]